MRCVKCPLVSGFLPVLLLILVLPMGCSDDDDGPSSVAPRTESVQLASVTLPMPVCNDLEGDPPVGTSLQYQDCLEYTHDYQGRLSFRHRCARFNCCADSVAVDISRSGNVITITEHEIQLSGGCDCECPFDLEYAVEGIEPGTYTIVVYDPHRCQCYEHRQLMFSVDLTATSAGRFSVDRSLVVGVGGN